MCTFLYGLKYIGVINMYHSCLFTYSFLVTQLQAVFHFFRVIIGSGSHAFPLVKSGLLHTKKQCSFFKSNKQQKYYI